MIGSIIERKDNQDIKTSEIRNPQIWQYQIIYDGKQYKKESYLKIYVEVNQDGKEYTAYIPSLPGCVSRGDSISEALENIKEAFEGCLEEYGSISNVPFKEPEYNESASYSGYVLVKVE